MSLSKRKAISECKKLWTEIVASGLSKSNFLWGTDGGQKWQDKEYDSNCPLCDSSKCDCSDCPLIVQYDRYCSQLGYDSDEDCRKYFLEYVNELK